jgi:hypothetical protein
MIKDNTVLIVGAGAGVPYGFPTGYQLRINICNGIDEKLRKLKNYSEDELIYPEEVLQEVRRLAEVFNKSGVLSIDLFLARNPSFEEIGKYCIFTEIYTCEKKYNITSIVEDNWYQILFNKIIQDCIGIDGYKNLKNNHLSIITFNYDRSLDYFLEVAIKNAYYESKIMKQIDSGEVNIQDIYGFDIIHVYGRIGKLPSQNNGKGIEFNSEHTPIFHPLLKNMRLINQRSDDDDTINKLLSAADKVLFLGFGFDSENMKLLGFPTEKRYINVYGTSYGLNNVEIDKIGSKYFKSSCSLESKTSSELLLKYL